MADLFRLDNRMAIVTGGGGGIGRAIALAFAGAGAGVAVFDLDEKAAAATAEQISGAGGRALSMRVDVADEHNVVEAVEMATAALGAPRVLLNGAAAHDPTGTVVDVDPAIWSRTFAINVGGAHLTSRAVIPRMAAAGGGSVIHIASQLGRVGARGRALYCATKGALIQMAKAMALDHAGQGIRVNTLSPGAIETGRMLMRHGSMEAARRYSTPLHPIGRLGQPEEIAQAALYLASDASSFMTGADLLVDGGYTAL